MLDYCWFYYDSEEFYKVFFINLMNKISNKVRVGHNFIFKGVINFYSLSKRELEPAHMITNATIDNYNYK